MSKIDPRPSAKTGTTTTAGALVLVAGYILNDQFGLGVDGEVIAAGVFLVMTAVAALMPAREPGKYEAE